MTLGKKDKRIQISRKELRINLEKLQSDVENVYQTLKKMVPESITNKEIKGFGNASHIILPKEYAGKKATVIIRESNDK
ncbi:MAG TPA: DUF2080 family transposase-associated protein [Candidatus Nanoarchaeia archaeon]|nr:DUF2080 family transposase-associated protein [Candidatus Nanoarchaeia archaeon]